MRKFVAAVAIGLMVLACSSGSSSGLTGKVWQWSAMTEKVPASQSVVPDPQNYTIEFKGDGTYALKADCNAGLRGLHDQRSRTHARARSDDAGRLSAGVDGCDLPAADLPDR